LKKNLKNHIEEKLRKKQLKKLISFFLFIISFNANSLEIIRDPIAEDYFQSLSNNNNDFHSYIVFDSKPNAFVIENNIYFTTELIKLIEDEDTLKSIYFHELGHIVHNHYSSKKIKVLDTRKSNSLNNLLSLGLAVISGNPNIGIVSNLAINQKLLSDISYNSIKYEIQADDFMLSKIKERNLNTKGLINFIENLPENQNVYFATHPRNEDRINMIKSLVRTEPAINSPEFNWIKAKYGKNSKIDDFNEFFLNLDKGIVSQVEEKSIPNAYINYEMYKKGISRLNNEEIFQELYYINDNSFLKIEYFNYIIDNQLSDLYELIEKNKENKAIQNEYYFHYIYGKYYEKLNNLNLSKFYFCQFFKTTNQSQKIDYYCNNYDKNKISNLDNSYALPN
jgi:hypothetical protein